MQCLIARVHFYIPVFHINESISCNDPDHFVSCPDKVYMYMYMYIYISISLSIYLYITNCRQYCFGLLGLISAVLMSGMEVKLIKPSQMSHTCGTSKPCQSAQTSELVSMRICIYIYSSLALQSFCFHVQIEPLAIAHAH